MNPDFLLAAMRMQEFKGDKMLSVKAGLLHLAITGLDFTAADLPAGLTAGSKHIAGASTGALVALGLIIVVDRVKSPNPNAKGRKVDVLRLAPGKRGTVLAFFKAHNLPLPSETQLTFA